MGTIYFRTEEVALEIRLPCQLSSKLPLANFDLVQNVVQLADDLLEFVDFVVNTWF